MTPLDDVMDETNLSVAWATCGRSVGLFDLGSIQAICLAGLGSCSVLRLLRLCEMAVRAMLRFLCVRSVCSLLRERMLCLVSRCVT